LTSIDPRLEAVLSDGRRRHLTGPGELAVQIDHALGFLDALRMGDAERAAVGSRVLDLGSGGGLPGLVIAVSRPDLRMVLLDSNLRRTEFLCAAVDSLDLHDRVTVTRARAEEAGHEPELRGSFDAVVARGFGRPAVTAECGAPFLRAGGRLAVSEPPGGNADEDVRWPAPALAKLGLVPLAVHRGDFSYQVLEQEAPCPDAYARRSGTPAKRPLF
jgi:16S rRNA (guanine527-N7)-methyltransferase